MPVRQRVGGVESAIAAAVVLLLALPASAPAQNPGSDQWRPVVRDGFGDPRTIAVEELEAVGGQLYAATRRRPGSGPAAVLTTADGGTTWQPVPFVPPLPPRAEAVTALGSGPDGALVAGTSDRAGGALYVLDGGVFRRVGAWPSRRGVAIAPGLLVTPSHVYFGTQRRGGAELWRLDRADGAITRLLDFRRIDRSVDLVGPLATFRGRIHAGTRTPGANRAALWSSATGRPGSWRVVRASRRGFSGVERRLNTAGNQHVGVAMTEFEGGFWVSADNPRAGGQMLHTRDGRRWRVIMVAGVDRPYNRALIGLQPFEGALWMAGVTRAPGGASVFEARSDFGGIGFGEMNDPGFGDRTTRGGSPDLAVLGDALWWGGENRRTGAQLWRLAAADLRRMTATGPGVVIDDAPVRLTPSNLLRFRVTCPAEDPYGCHGSFEVRTERRLRAGRRLQRFLVAREIYELDSGETRVMAFRLPRAEARFLRRRLPLRLLVKAFAFDNAENTSATVTLTR